MEFLVISSPHLEGHGKTLRQQLAVTPLLADVDGPLGFFDEGGLFVAANGHQSDDISSVCFDGHAVEGNKAYATGNATAPSLPTANRYIDECLGPSNSCTMRGVFSFMRFNPHTKAFTIVNDPLSLYPVFICGLGETLLAGNSILLLEKALLALGHRLTRTSKSGAMEAAFGCGAGTRTGFREVALLPPGKLVTGIGPNWRLVETAPWASPEGRSYQDQLSIAADRLCDTVGAIAGSARDQQLMFDLTGGLDSRLVFAAAVAADVPDLSIFAGGTAASEDKQIAHLLAAQYKAAEASLPANHTGEPPDATELAKRAAFRQQGSSNLHNYALGRGRMGNLFRVRGSGGELLRTFTAPPAANNLFWQEPLKNIARISGSEPVHAASLAAFLDGISSQEQRSAARWAYTLCQSPPSHHQHYRRAFLREGTRSVIQQLREHAASAPTMGMDFYLKDRARRHFGFLSRGLGLAYGAYDPLMDPVLLQAAASLPWDKRAQGTFVFDLMEKLAGRAILDVPFTEKSLTPSMRKVLAKRLNRSEKSLRLTKGPLIELPPAKFAVQTTDLPMHEIAGTQGLGRFGQIFHANQTAFLNLAGALSPQHEYWQYFDRNQILKSLKGQSYFLRNETTATRGVRMFHTLIWAAGVESQCGIDTQI